EAQSAWVLLALTVLLSLPLILGFARASGRYAQYLAERVLPDSQLQGRVLLQRGVRTLLVLSFGLPVAALLVPATGLVSGVVVLVLVGILALWTLRATEGADAELRSGAGRVLDLLEARLSSGEQAAGASSSGPQELVEGTRTLTVLAHAKGVGLSLAQLDLRAKTGATVVGIRSPGGQTLGPQAHLALQVGDVLLLAGPDRALQDAEQLLLEGPQVTGSRLPGG
ncbi:MAG: CPA2 family monovalent cation:H+ antiporter-2, partial [Cognaticolwellia sp.]